MKKVTNKKPTPSEELSAIQKKIDDLDKVEVILRKVADENNIRLSDQSLH